MINSRYSSRVPVTHDLECVPKRSRGPGPAEANDSTGQFDKAKVVLGMNFVANLEPTEQVVPTVGTLHNPPVGSPAGMLAGRWLLAAVRDVRDVAAPSDHAADVEVVIALVQAEVLLDLPGRRPGNHAAVEHLSQLGLVMIIGSRQRRIQRDALPVGLDVAFRAQLGPVRRVLADTIAPPTGAEIVAESTVCHCQSMPLRSSYSFKHRRHSSWNTPERTHAWKWRWADEPEPYSRGIIFHWQPVRNTYRMPLKTIRCSFGRRPPFGPIGWSGISGVRTAQNSSGTSRQPGCRFNGLRFSRRRRFGPDVPAAVRAVRDMRWSSTSTSVIDCSVSKS